MNQQRNLLLSLHCSLALNVVNLVGGSEAAAICGSVRNSDAIAYQDSGRVGSIHSIYHHCAYTLETQ